MNNVVRAFTATLAFVICCCQLSDADSPQATAGSEQKGRELMDLVLASLRRSFPTDVELSQRLAQRREDFEKLVTMAQEDKEVIRIAPDFTWTTSRM